MKKLMLMIPLLLLTACGAPKVDMDQLSADGKYHYENQDLGFAVTLPPEFIYYQTQRLAGDGFVDVEFFVPTSDPMYVDEAVPSYAKPIVVRAYDMPAFGREAMAEEDFAEVGRGQNLVYAIKFWDRLPKDWEGKWDEGMREGIEDSFKIK